MFSYFACGIGIRSALHLPELTAANVPADLVVRLGRVEAPSAEFDERGSAFVATPEEVRLQWKGVGAFQIRGGHEIVVDPSPDVDEGVLRLFLLGRVLATLLHQRGLLVLHASAVAADGYAVAFLGGKGWGKSTLAGALYARGHSVVADDVVAVDVDGPGSPIVFPGFPQLKLWPEAAASLGEAVDALPRLHPSFEKRARTVPRGFSRAALPLKRIYVLDEGDEREIATLKPTEAFVELVRHSYAANLLEATGTASLHFSQCGKLVDSVSICRLTKTDSLLALPELVAFVKEDIGNSVRERYRCVETR